LHKNSINKTNKRGVEETNLLKKDGSLRESMLSLKASQSMLSKKAREKRNRPRREVEEESTKEEGRRGIDQGDGF